MSTLKVFTGTMAKIIYAILVLLAVIAVGLRNTPHPSGHAAQVGLNAFSAFTTAHIA